MRADIKTYKYFIIDFVERTKEEYFEKIKDSQKLQMDWDSEDEVFYNGLRDGLYWGLSNFRKDAIKFRLPLEELVLKQPITDLITKKHEIEISTIPVNIDTYKIFLKEFVEKTKQKYFEEIENSQQSKKLIKKDGKEELFISGEKYGLYCVLENLRSEAKTFMLPLETIGLREPIPLG